MAGVVLITGTSSGVGLASAVGAARAGFTVVAAMRDPARGGALREATAKADVEVDVTQLDVTDAASITTCMDGLVRRHGRLDALVNNAGMASAHPSLELADLDSLRATMEVNFFGLIAVSQAAMPLLRASRGRLVTVGSVRGLIGQPFNEGYSASKFAVEGFMEGLAPVAAQVGVRVTIVEPAAVLDGGMVANEPGPTPAEMLETSGPYMAAFKAYRAFVGSGVLQGAAQMSADIAEVLVRTLTMADPPLRVYPSEYSRTYAARKLADPDGSAVQEMTRGWVSAD